VSPPSPHKREREKKKQERAAEKRRRRETRAAERHSAEDDQPEHDPTELMEEFRLVSERHAAGEIDDATYQVCRRSLFDQLGIVDPDL
jgi:hypothetical protein